MPSHRRMNRPSQFCPRSSQVFALSFVTRQREDKHDNAWSCVLKKQKKKKKKKKKKRKRRESEKEHEPRDDSKRSIKSYSLI